LKGCWPKLTRTYSFLLHSINNKQSILHRLDHTHQTA
jgi:hypothetical protein